MSMCSGTSDEDKHRLIWLPRQLDLRQVKWRLRILLNTFVSMTVCVCDFLVFGWLLHLLATGLGKYRCAYSRLAMIDDHITSKSSQSGSMIGSYACPLKTSFTTTIWCRAWPGKLGSRHRDTEKRKKKTKKYTNNITFQWNANKGWGYALEFTQLTRSVAFLELENFHFAANIVNDM